MFKTKDRVRLIEDFDNEPGIIPYYTEGTVMSTCEEDGCAVMVMFDDVSNLDSRAREINFETGLYMFPEEIEAI